MMLFYVDVFVPMLFALRLSILKNAVFLYAPAECMLGCNHLMKNAEQVKKSLKFRINEIASAGVPAYEGD